YSLHAADPAAADATMLKAAYPRVKQVAPNLKVLAGALAFSDGDFLERLYSNGIKGNFDGFSIHPYNEWRDPNDAWKPEWKKYTYITGVPWIQSILAAHGDGDKGLWLTELGWSTCGTGDTWCVTPTQQAQYVGDALRIAAGWSYVKATVIYNLRNKGTNPQGREDQFGIVQRDFSLKPAYASFHAALTGPLPSATGTGTGTTTTGTSTTTTTGTTTTGTTTTGTGTAPAPGVPETPAATVDRPSKPDLSAPPVAVSPDAAPLPFVVSIPDIAPVAPPAAPSKPAQVAVKIKCTPAATSRCRGRLELRSRAGVLLAAGRFDVRRGLFTTRPALTKAGRSTIKPGRSPAVIATVKTTGGLRILRVLVR
ncbi:MAG: polysaccharide biosynthesis protein PslG, partial [Thermoleophilaceae bacterium]|nr:polysaccharide biosynthesis protein PslG [Thermoleophilaceae bacterium]